MRRLATATGCVIIGRLRLFAFVFLAYEDVQQLVAIEATVANARTPSLDVRSIGPARAVQRVVERFPTDADRKVWEVEARARAIVGSCPRSLESARSGMRCWISYYRRGLGKDGNAFPPVLDDLLSFSGLFRHHGTFSNYLGYVKLACELLGVSTEVFDHSSVKRAKKAIEKRCQFVSRPPMFIKIGLVKQLVLLGKGGTERKVMSYLFLTAYVFLLRVPSEALPLAAHTSPGSSVSVPVVTVSESEVMIWWPRRKNRLQGSWLKRSCWCKACRETCPVHVLGAFFNDLPKGVQPFVGISAAEALKVLRAMLVALGAKDATLYRTHDFRRGHAEDLRLNGATLGEILRAGDWRSPSFLDYLDRQQLEHDRTVEAHLHDSSEGEA